MKLIEFFNASDVEMFADFSYKENMNYKEFRKSPVWLVSDEVATKMQEKHPFFDYGVIKDPVFRVEDTETGNAVIYIGESLPEAIGTILSDKNPEMWDLYAGDSRIWCGKTDTIKELKSL